MKIQIDKALASYTLKTGERMNRSELGRRVMPDVRESYRSTVLKQLAEGKAKRPDPQLIWDIALVTKTDLNFLYGWKDE